MPEVEKSKNRIVIPSSQDYLVEVDRFLETRLKEAGMNESDLADVAISVSEAVNNAIFHGNKCDLRKKITVRVKVESGTVEVQVEDQGKGFDPSEIANPVEGDNLLKQVGRGIFIIKSLMDRLDFSFAPEGGTILKMYKSFQTTRRSSSPEAGLPLAE